MLWEISVRDKHSMGIWDKYYATGSNAKAVIDKAFALAKKEGCEQPAVYELKALGRIEVKAK